MARHAKSKILVVDDEELVRAMVRAMLSQNGYEILEAGCGEEALSLWESQPDGIRVLLTDVLMPGMGGPELARRIKHHTPATAVIFMSGYSDEPVIDGAGELDYGFIAKPFTAGDLAAAVRGALDKA